jgi:hypothetical protein
MNLASSKAWQAAANYQIFQAEAGLGMRLFPGLSVEAGSLWQYRFTRSQENRRIALPGTDGPSFHGTGRRLVRAAAS